MTFPCRELTGIRHDGKAKDQFLGTDAAATDTKPRTGMEISDNNRHQRQL
jgi:hypothetical protein